MTLDRLSLPALLLLAAVAEYSAARADADERNAAAVELPERFLDFSLPLAMEFSH